MRAVTILINYRNTRIYPFGSWLCNSLCVIDSFIATNCQQYLSQYAKILTIFDSRYFNLLVLLH